MSDLQRTEDWFADRLGKATASRFNDIMKGKAMAGWKNYRAELVIERITGQKEEGYTSKPMQWGIDTEPVARTIYQLRSGNIVEECGFFKHSVLEAGASPDGLIGADGVIEIKSPNSATHIATLSSGKIPTQYYAQIQGQMWITGRQWGDFVSYDPRLPENASIIIVRVERDNPYIARLEQNVTDFLAEVDAEYEFVKGYKA